jgi:hypothetical protein
MTRADSIDASWLSLRSLFPGNLDSEAETLIKELVRKCDPPIRVVQESTWALKLGGLMHCAVCKNVRGLRVELARGRRGLCEEHSDWKIFYRHHSWDVFEQHSAALKHLRQWLAEASTPTESPSDT